ncbi:MAG: hypothetical protein JNJ86_07805, partial [Chitinophagaceae bacterium]|nr:hypothetical protein [Chitinophagaceae bacterium]
MSSINKYINTSKQFLLVIGLLASCSKKGNDTSTGTTPLVYANVIIQANENYQVIQG